MTEEPVETVVSVEIDKSSTVEEKSGPLSTVSTPVAGAPSVVSVPTSGGDGGEGGGSDGRSRGVIEGDEAERRTDRPMSSSSGSRGSVHSSASRISMSPYQRTTPYGASKLMAYKAGAFENALAECSKSVITPEDGDVIGNWLLIDIDHWDFEREKLFILTKNSLLAVKFDFITPAVKYFKRVPLKNIEFVDIGDLAYPTLSFMGGRDYGGLRIHWCKESPWFYQRWNPWCEDVGFITLTHHMLIYNEKEQETTTYNVSDFADSLVQAVNEQRRQDQKNELLTVNEGPITINSYANVGSLIFNQSRIGYNLDRGGVNY